MTEAASAMEQALEQQMYGQTPGANAPAPQQESGASPMFDFDDEFQERVAALALRDSVFARRTEGLIRPEYFEKSADGILVSLAQDFWEKYRNVPQDLPTWKQVLKEAMGKRIRDNMKDEVLTRFKELMQAPVNNRDFAVDTVARFARRQELYRVYMENIEAVEKGEIEKVEDAFMKAFKVGAVADFQEVDYWGSVEQRTERRKDEKAGNRPKRGISTGLPRLNKLLYHEGWGRKEMSVIMGGAKKGKSMGLGHFALRASLLGYNALYLTLEVSDEIISERMDANLSKVAMQEMGDKIMEVEQKVKDAAKRAGQLRIIEFPTGSLRPSDIRRILDSYRAEGLIFDLIVVDYADIMIPDHRTYDERQDSKEVWIQLRAIAGEEDAAMLTATQTNRDGFKASTAKAEHAAEDFNKIRIADLVLSINRDDDERARGEARLYFAASRNQGGEFTVRVQQNMEQMEFISNILGIE